VTRGFSEGGKPDVAVCLLPGTELAFDENVEYERAFPLLPNVKLNEKTARFRQIIPAARMLGATHLSFQTAGRVAHTVVFWSTRYRAAAAGLVLRHRNRIEWSKARSSRCLIWKRPSDGPATKLEMGN
jgi:hypothetical protein